MAVTVAGGVPASLTLTAQPGDFVVAVEVSVTGGAPAGLTFTAQAGDVKVSISHGARASGLRLVAVQGNVVVGTAGGPPRE